MSRAPRHIKREAERELGDFRRKFAEIAEIGRHRRAREIERSVGGEVWQRSRAQVSACRADVRG